MKDIIKVSLVIIGTMIGAGFASGQEIGLFFNRYGIVGLVGIIVSSILTGLIINKVFSILQKKQIHTYSELLALLSKNSKMNKIIQIIILLFLLISFYIMVAGFCAYFVQEWKIPIIIPAILMAVLCYITFHKDIQGVLSVNNILMPLLILFVFYLGSKNLHFSVTFFTQKANLQIENTWIRGLFSSILYASYNSILLIPILIELSPYMDTKSKIKRISFNCSIVLGVLGVLLYCLLLRGNGYIQAVELPMLQIVKEFGKIYPWIYGLVIIAAIFTSCISAGYGFLTNIATTPKTYQKFAILLCTTAILIAPIGFSNLVTTTYPFFGILGLVQIFLLFKYNVSN